MGEPHRHGGFTPRGSFKGYVIYSEERRKLNFARRKNRRFPLDEEGEKAWLVYTGRKPATETVTPQQQ